MAFVAVRVFVHEHKRDVPNRFTRHFRHAAGAFRYDADRLPEVDYALDVDRAVVALYDLYAPAMSISIPPCAVDAVLADVPCRIYEEK